MKIFCNNYYIEYILINLCFYDIKILYIFDILELNILNYIILFYFIINNLIFNKYILKNVNYNI
jgi:hypothetical protein